jgi:hypothetical protein
VNCENAMIYGRNHRVLYKCQEFILDMLNLDAWKTSRGEIKELVPYMTKATLGRNIKSHRVWI